MIKPDDDFEDGFNDSEPVEEETNDSIQAQSTTSDGRDYDTRRKIEDLLERRRLKEEFGDLGFD